MIRPDTLTLVMVSPAVVAVIVPEAVRAEQADVGPTL